MPELSTPPISVERSISGGHHISRGMLMMWGRNKQQQQQQQQKKKKKKKYIVVRFVSHFVFCIVLLTTFNAQQQQLRFRYFCSFPKLFFVIGHFILSAPRFPRYLFLTPARVVRLHKSRWRPCLRNSKDSPFHIDSPYSTRFNYDVLSGGFPPLDSSSSSNILRDYFMHFSQQLLSTTCSTITNLTPQNDDHYYQEPTTTTTTTTLHHVTANPTRTREVLMPAVMKSVQGRRIIRWLKSPGDEIQVGDDLVVLDAEGNNITVTSALQGCLMTQLVHPGETVPVGKTIALLVNNLQEFQNLISLQNQNVKRNEMWNNDDKNGTILLENTTRIMSRNRDYATGHLDALDDHGRTGDENVEIRRRVEDCRKPCNDFIGETAPIVASVTKFVGKCDLPTARGVIHVRSYHHSSHGDSFDVMAIYKGIVDGRRNVALRVHDQCLTSEVFGSQRCDCKEQLDLALQMVHDNDALIIYLLQEGRGIGLANKIAAYSLQDSGMDTVDANRYLGFHDDDRSYKSVPFILQNLGVQSVRLFTNNPRKIQKLVELEISIEEVLPLIIEPNKHNRRYLLTKQHRMAHRLSLADGPRTFMPPTA